MDNYVFLMHFNLPNVGKDMYGGNPSWIEERINLFEKYTLPSLESQTDKGFIVVMFCDPDTPSLYREKLLNYEKSYNFIKVYWTKNSLSIQEGVNINEEVDKFLEFYKSIRINDSEEIYISICDNDDIIHKQYVEISKSVYNQLEEHYDLICYAYGIYWDINTNNFLYSYFPTNSFFVAKSTLSKFFNPRYENHIKVVTENKSFVIPMKDPMWIQIIHGGNQWNRLDRMPGTICNFDIDELKEYFGF